MFIAADQVQPISHVIFDHKPNGLASEDIVVYFVGAIQKRDFHVLKILLYVARRHRSPSSDDHVLQRQAAKKVEWILDWLAMFHKTILENVCNRFSGRSKY